MKNLGPLPLDHPLVVRALLWGTSTNAATVAVMIPESRSLPAGRGETAALTPTVGGDRQEEEQ